MSTDQKPQLSGLAEKVYRCVSMERDGAHEARNYATPEDQRSGVFTIFELDQQDFSLVVGLAYGIARGEDPYESVESVTERAGAAAREAFDRWGHFELTFEQDRAARPVPVLYPHSDLAPSTDKPWNPLQDAAGALETCAALVDGDERKMLSEMGEAVGNLALEMFRRRLPTDGEETC
jgi:hypothetical protein